MTACNVIMVLLVNKNPCLLLINNTQVFSHTFEKNKLFFGNNPVKTQVSRTEEKQCGIIACQQNATFVYIKITTQQRSFVFNWFCT